VVVIVAVVIVVVVVVLPLREFVHMIETGVPVVLFDPSLNGTGSLEPDKV
jgi:hypothetical protein